MVRQTENQNPRANGWQPHLFYHDHLVWIIEDSFLDFWEFTRVCSLTLVWELYYYLSRRCVCFRAEPEALLLPSEALPLGMDCVRTRSFTHACDTLSSISISHRRGEPRVFDVPVTFTFELRLPPPRGGGGGEFRALAPRPPLSCLRGGGRSRNVIIPTANGRTSNKSWARRPGSCWVPFDDFLVPPSLARRKLDARLTEFRPHSRH